jgi:uncharacterized protein (TIGR03437 family)
MSDQRCKFATPVAPGSLVSIFGFNFAPQVAQVATIPLTTSLAGVSVSFNSLIVPLLYVAPPRSTPRFPTLGQCCRQQ